MKRVGLFIVVRYRSQIVSIPFAIPCPLTKLWRMSKVLVNEALTRKIANLARLELTDTEVGALTSHMDKILGYVESLQKVDVSAVAPLTQPFEVPTPLREDVIIVPLKDQEGKPKVLASAPDVLNDGFKVPPIL